MKKYIKYLAVGCVVVVLILFSFRKHIMPYITFSPKVSVVMSTYNRADLLPRAIDSILNQTYKDFEFIIINDGSSDETADLLNEYAEQDSRIKIITNNPNAGLITSLNRGLEAARGEYIARMDDDDVSYLNRFEKQVAFLDKHPEFTVVGSWVSPIDSDRPYHFQRETNPDLIHLGLLLGNIEISHPALMMRRDFLNQHHIRYQVGYESAEDRPFYWEIVSAGGRITNIPEPLLHYRFHGSNSRKYYVKQQQNIRRFHNSSLREFISKVFLYPFDRCEVLPYIIKANQEKKLFDPSVLQKHYTQQCGGEGSERIKLVHPFWVDRAFIKDNRLKRMDGDQGTIIDRSSDQFVIKWDRYGTEIFVKNKDGSYHLKEESKK